VNECLISVQVGKFHVQGGSSSSTNFPKLKAKNKLRYVCIVRSTNRVLMTMREESTTTTERPHDGDGDNDDDNKDDEDVYNAMYTEYNATDHRHKTGQSSHHDKQPPSSQHHHQYHKSRLEHAVYDTKADKEEISSFPHLLCLAIHSDGTSPDIRKAVDLTTLVSVTTVKSSEQGNNNHHHHNNHHNKNNLYSISTTPPTFVFIFATVKRLRL